MSVRTLGQTVRSATAYAFRTFVIGLAVYGGLDLMRSAMAQDAGTAYLPVTANAEEITSLEDRVGALEDLLVHVSRDGNDIYVTGANLHVVNGEGRTDSENGLGNVIVGYNEERTGQNDINERSGSHTVVVGSQNNYSSYGGLVAGYANAVSGRWASTVGGSHNAAMGSSSSVSGGYANKAIGNWSSVCGGNSSAAVGTAAAVSGGGFNLADGDESSVSGGAVNAARAYGASVAGGYGNAATGDRSTVSGGRGREASGIYEWRAGDLFQEN